MQWITLPETEEVTAPIIDPDDISKYSKLHTGDIYRQKYDSLQCEKYAFDESFLHILDAAIKSNNLDLLSTEQKDFFVRYLLKAGEITNESLLDPIEDYGAIENNTVASIVTSSNIIDNGTLIDGDVIPLDYGDILDLVEGDPEDYGVIATTAVIGTTENIEDNGMLLDGSTVDNDYGLITTSNPTEISYGSVNDTYIEDIIETTITSIEDEETLYEVINTNITEYLDYGELDENLSAAFSYGGIIYDTESLSVLMQQFDNWLGSYKEAE
jgi:hypothetical protein